MSKAMSRPLTLFTTLCTVSQAFALTVSGKVINSQNKKPVIAATIAIKETGDVAITDLKGNYTVNIEKAAKYTFIVQANGLQSQQLRKEIKTDTKINFNLQLLTIQGDLIEVDIAKRREVSQKSLGNENLKNAPATFGDALNALSTLPGIIRTNGPLGPLIIRGAKQEGNSYLIDGIPVLYPQHYGALQSVISNDLIDEINAYASAYPAGYKQAYGGVIDIRTKDNIKGFSGVIDASLISANFYLQSDFRSLRKNSVITGDEPEEIQKGYWISSGRIGYLTVLIPPIYKLITGKSLVQLPEYYDYQLKGKYNFGESGVHSITALFIGSYDTWKLVTKRTQEEIDANVQDGSDPLLGNVNFRNRIFSNSQGLYYTYLPGDKFKNVFTLYNALNDSVFFIDGSSVESKGLEDRTLDVTVRPNISGLRNNARLDLLKDMLTIEGSVEYNMYWFWGSGQTQRLTRPNVGQGNPDFGNSSLFVKTPLNINVQNHLLSGHIRNIITLGPVEISPGVRIDYLELNKEATVGPRGAIVYNITDEINIHGAAGLYHLFPQINANLFNQPFNQQPQVATLSYINAERAEHYVAGADYSWSKLFKVTLEGFYNQYSNLLVSDGVNNRSQAFSNLGSGDSVGFEVLFQKDRRKNLDDFYGWASYTYTKTRYKTGVTSGTFDGNASYPFQFDQTHSLKLVTGYKWGINQLGVRFELASGFPYTPVIGSQQFVSGRYSQMYGTPYSQRFGLNHRLDIRYSRVVKYSNSTLKWYVELINVYNFQPKNQLKWSYNKPYSERVNPKLTAGQGFPFTPNFGVELRF